MERRLFLGLHRTARTRNSFGSGSKRRETAFPGGFKNRRSSACAGTACTSRMLAMPVTKSSSRSKPRPKPRMRSRTPAAGVEVPPKLLLVHAQFGDPCMKLAIIGLTLRSADDFADSGEQYVHSAYGLAVVVLLHVEGLDLLGIVDQDDGTLEVLLDQITLVLRSAGRSPSRSGNSNLRPEAFSISMPSV